MNDSLIAKNKRAYHDYEIIDSYEAGIALQGTEVKSLRAGQLVLKDSYIDVDSGEMFLKNAHIAPYEQGNQFNHEPERPRKLLMHKHEIIKIGSKTVEKGMTLIPLRVYFKRGKVKVQVGLCKGKDRADKRHALKAQEAKRDVDRAVREAQKD
ncbi:SsrA-binding protein SmpB [bacterium AH-315-P07]|nr:SsrA-binding protein SmpB [bacterium AH-315-P07]